MSLIKNFKLFLFYRFFLKPMLKKYDERDFLMCGIKTTQYMMRKVGTSTWKEWSAALTSRVRYFLKGIRYGLK